MTPRNAMYWIRIGLLAPPVYGLLTLWATLTLLARAVRKRKHRETVTRTWWREAQRGTMKAEWTKE